MLEELGQNYVTVQDNADIIRTPPEEEINECIGKLHPLKSPGPDSFLGFFFQSYWSVVKDRVVRFTQECFRLKKVSSDP